MIKELAIILGFVIAFSLGMVYTSIVRVLKARRKAKNNLKRGVVINLNADKMDKRRYGSSKRRVKRFHNHEEEQL